MVYNKYAKHTRPIIVRLAYMYVLCFVTAQAKRTESPLIARHHDPKPKGVTSRDINHATCLNFFAPPKGSNNMIPLLLDLSTSA